MSETYPGGQPNPEAAAASGDAAEVEAGQSPEQDRGQLHPAIWVGSLLDYTNGILHGDWLNAARDVEELHTDIQRIMAISPTTRQTGEPAEEWGIFDYEDFGTWKPGEYEDLTIVAAIARGIAEHGPAFAAWADLHDADPDMLDGFGDAYLGEYDSLDVWAESVMDEMGTRDEIDRVLEEKVGDIAVIHKPGGGVWVFNANP